MSEERPRPPELSLTARVARALLVCIAVVLVLSSVAACGSTGGQAATSQAAVAGDAALARAFHEQQYGIEVEGAGTVARVLADDVEGGRHQRFILELASGQTVLIAHNIDVAARLDGLEAGDEVAFRGVYEWNARGGVVHWTHHDPSGEHDAGWLRLDGRTVQ